MGIAIDRDRWIIAAACAVAALLLFGNAGFRSLFRGYVGRRHLTRVVTRLRVENRSLSLEWQRLQQDPSYTEYLIRKNLGYVKKGEVEYRWKANDKKR